MLPSQHHCLEPSEFIGPARGCAEQVDKFCRTALAEKRAPVRMAFLGEPGTGKSDLADYAATLLGATQFSTHEKNGACFRIEDVEAWTRTMQLREMYGNYRVFRVEEVDSASRAASIAMLTMLDRLPPGNAFIVTSNQSIKEFECRFQRRFQVYQVGAPSVDEIAELLIRRHRITPTAARAIAAGAVLNQGYVGQALNDADAEVANPGAVCFA